MKTKDLVDLLPAGAEGAVGEIVEEYISIRENFRPFASKHEGFAVLLEEVDELKDLVWKGKRDEFSRDLRKEAMQIAAVALAFMVDLT